MASVKGTNFTNITATIPSCKNIAAVVTGKLRVQYDSFEASSLASGSDISVARSLQTQQCQWFGTLIMHDALGGVTLKVGDAADDDRYVFATDVANAGVISSCTMTEQSTDLVI